VVESHEDGTFNTYRWSGKGDSLSLTWLEGTIPPSGIPDEVYQTALYMTADFQRES
jgi:hypothetical protein